MNIVMGALAASAVWAVAAIFVSGAVVKEWLSPMATISAAAVAGWVAYALGKSQISVAKAQAEIAKLNWSTENGRVVLELFDRRLAIAEEIRSIIGEVVRNGAAPHPLYNRYLEATNRVPYFFGKEVQAYVETLRLALIDLDYLNKTMAQGLGPNQVAVVTKRTAVFQSIVDFYKTSPPLFAPYLSAHQRID